MKKILNIVGTRPQFIKAATISRVIKSFYSESIHEILVHSGQHYDANMSDIFFDELALTKADYHFRLQDLSNKDRLRHMTLNFERLIQKENPDMVLLYGDTDTTLAGTYAATNCKLPIAHIEAGLRSHNPSLPEEFNRYTCDHASSLLFCPTKKAFHNLQKEGFEVKNSYPIFSKKPAVYFSGDVMYDSLLFALKNNINNDGFESLDWKNEKFILATIHRNVNTDDRSRLNKIFEALIALAENNNQAIVIPLHPRTNKIMKMDHFSLFKKLSRHPNLKIIKPYSYFQSIHLLKHAELVITDSGGLQKEAYWCGKVSIVLRDETEWKELIENNYSILCHLKDGELQRAYEKMRQISISTEKQYYGDGKAAEFIMDTIIKSLKNIHNR